MMYAFVIPDSPKNYLLWLAAGLCLASLLVLRIEYSKPERQPGLTFVVIILLALFYSGYEVVLPLGPYEVTSERVINACIAVFALIMVAYFMIHYFRRSMMDYGLSPYYEDGVTDVHDLRLLKYDLYGGKEDRVLQILMRDARVHDRMHLYQQLSNMHNNLQEKEILANQDPSKKGDLYYQKFFLRKDLEEILDKDPQNFR